MSDENNMDMGVKSLSYEPYLFPIIPMDKEQKNMFYRNIVKFIVWIALLTVSYGYIQNHPAEKASIVSGFQVMYERAQIFVYNLLGKDTTVLAQKQQLEQYYEEIVKKASQKNCASRDLINEITSVYESFKHDSLTELAAHIQYYRMKAADFDLTLQKPC